MPHTRFIALIAAAAGVLAGSAQSASARTIFEDFYDLGGGPIFDDQLTYDFGTDSDFTGTADTHDLFAGELNLYADSAMVTVNDLAPGEYIESIQVLWTDFCGVDCTTLEVFGATGSFSLSNMVVGAEESVSINTGDLGEQITSFSLSSSEGRIEEFTVFVVPAPGSLACLCALPILMGSRRRR